MFSSVSTLFKKIFRGLFAQAQWKKMSFQLSSELSSGSPTDKLV